MMAVVDNIDRTLKVLSKSAKKEFVFNEYFNDPSTVFDSFTGLNNQDFKEISL